MKRNHYETLEEGENRKRERSFRSYFPRSFVVPASEPNLGGVGNAGGCYSLRRFPTIQVSMGARKQFVKNVCAT